MPFAACLYTPYIPYPRYKFITVKIQQQQEQEQFYISPCTISFYISKCSTLLS